MIVLCRTVMGRRLRLLLLSAALLPALSLSALAAPEDGEASAPEAEVPIVSAETDVTYSGPLDPRTGLPASGLRAGEENGYVTLRDGVSGFDLEQGCYVNQVGALSFTSSIPDGALLSAGAQTVSFSVPGGLSAVLYRNGEALDDPELSAITEAGSYILDVRESNSSERLRFSFRLLGALTGSLSELSLPAGFTFDVLRLNGETLTPEYANYTTLLQDGVYEVRWSCAEIGKSYTVSFERDTVAPTLALPEVTDGEAHSAVTFTDLEDGCYVMVTDLKTGETRTIVSPETELKDAGTYHLAVCDQAGNSTAYDFTIHVYLNISALAAITLVLGGAICLCLYARYIRKHPRVG